MPERFPLGYVGEKENLPAVKPLDKYYVIYKRTKKARIKKKAAKKSWILTLQRKSKEPIIITVRSDTK